MLSRPPPHLTSQNQQQDRYLPRVTAKTPEMKSSTQGHAAGAGPGQNARPRGCLLRAAPLPQWEGLLAKDTHGGFMKAGFGTFLPTVSPPYQTLILTATEVIFPSLLEPPHSKTSMMCPNCCLLPSVNTALSCYRIGQWVSKRVPWAISITWECVRNANCQAPPQTF